MNFYVIFGSQRAQFHISASSIGRHNNFRTTVRSGEPREGRGLFSLAHRRSRVCHDTARSMLTLPSLYFITYLDIFTVIEDKCTISTTLLSLKYMGLLHIVVTMTPRDGDASKKHAR